MSDLALPRRRPWAIPVLGLCVAYVALALLSTSTAFVQINTAAVWIPSGFAVGLLIVRGPHLWPVVAVGSFVFNLALNLSNSPPPSLITSLVVAGSIALGNTGEAVLGAMLARRFASADLYLSQTRDAVVFALLVAPLPPLVSTLVGVAASRLGALEATGTFWDITLTWYVGNYVGILVFTGLTILILTRAIHLPSRARAGEALALTLCLCFVGQAICGFFLSGWIGDWLKTYMAIPLILWACFRFGIAGGPLSIALITVIAVIGTLRGYVAFPSKSPWMALIYLQVFVGMLSVISMVVSASIAELKANRAMLEERVRFRTREIESLMREREVFTVLVAHDLQSPLYGIRNALRASASAYSSGRLEGADLGAALNVMEKSCSTLAERVASLLFSSRDQIVVDGEAKNRSLTLIVQRIASAHGLRLYAPDARLVQRGDLSLCVSRPDDVEHIVDTLVDNALKYTPDDAPIHLAVFQHGRWIEIHVTDHGPGLSAAARQSLFRPRRHAPLDVRRPGTGLGLYLASEKAGELGGRLTYAPTLPHGSTFRLVVPA